MFKLLSQDKMTNDFIKTSFGNILEWYDFSIYGLFAVQIAQTFFPKGNSGIGLLLTLLTFGIGFIARPAGSIIFGYIGDRRGKHYAVNLSIWCMAVPTTIIGLLPGYNVIGIFAPILLVLLRIAQGVSAGGQFSGLIAIAVDNNAKKSSFLTSLVYTISIVGTLLASIVAFLSNSIFNEFTSWGNLANSLTWRVPFLFSGIIFGIYAKLKPDYHSHPEDNAMSFSFKEIFSLQPTEMIGAIILSASTGALYYILFSYAVTYMQLHMQFSKLHSLFILNIMLTSSIILFPKFGFQADNCSCKISKVKKYTYGVIGGALLLFFDYYTRVFTSIGILIMVVSFCAIIGYTTSLFGEIFNKKYRMTACSLSFNLGIIVAGFAPFFSELSTGYRFGFQFLILSVVLILLFSLVLLYKTKGYKRIMLNNNFVDSRYRLDDDLSTSLEVKAIKIR